MLSPYLALPLEDVDDLGPRSIGVTADEEVGRQIEDWIVTEP